MSLADTIGAHTFNHLQIYHCRNGFKPAAASLLQFPDNNQICYTDKSMSNILNWFIPYIPCESLVNRVIFNREHDFPWKSSRVVMTIIRCRQKRMGDTVDNLGYFPVVLYGPSVTTRAYRGRPLRVVTFESWGPSGEKLETGSERTEWLGSRSTRMYDSLRLSKLPSHS